MLNPILPTIQTNDPKSEWHITQQWESLGLLHCRHCCQHGAKADKLHFKNEHTLGLLLSPRPFKFTHQQERKNYTGFYRQGDLLITPADMTLLTQAEGAVQILQLRLQDTFLKRVAEESLDQNGDRIQLIPNIQTQDPQMQAIAMMMMSELHQDSKGGSLYMDSLTNVLAIHLLRHHTTTRPQIPAYEGGLAQRQILQILDYIEAHLSREITLAELAELLNMSQFHFGRMFKQSLGISPYQYLLQQRVERAKRLLKQTDHSIMEIALACGFNSHSHLARQFRQQTGITPKAYRIT